ncbi:glycosyltransferase [Candidatus Pelagibacter sp.]|nr:glycosyltransferase [Candidatus Pelagibacter sp.]
MTTPKINILIFHPYSKIGGADLSISKLINNLNHNKYKIEFICLNRQKIKKYLKKNIKIHVIKSSKTIYSIFKVRKIIQNNLKKDFKKIIFLSNQNFANIISYFITYNLRTYLKTVAVERNHISELFTYFSTKDFFKKLIIKNLMKLTYNKFDMIIGNSKELSKDLGKYLNLKTHTIYNPVTNYHHKKNVAKKNKRVVLNVGRLENQKDHITLIKAIYLVNKKLDVNLIIIGNGSLYQMLTRLIINFQLEKKIKIINNINNPRPFYKKSNLFVLTSLYEGFPNVITESIGMNLPVISSDCKSGPAEILMSSRGPDIFTKGDYKDLSKKIVNHFKNPSILNKKCLKVKKSFNRFELKNLTNIYDKLFLNL